MLWNINSVTVVLTLFSIVYSDDAFLNETILIRVKRGKYYSYPSIFYRRPPNSYPIKGAFSVTPPPGYMMDDEEHPGRSHDRPKVSKRPNDGLRDEDINNIVKYLSKQDLDKLIDMASEKERYNSVEKRPYKREEPRIIRDNVQEYSSKEFSQIGPYKTHETDNKFNSNGHWVSQASDSRPTNYRQQEESYNVPYKTLNNEQFSSFKPQELNDQNLSGPYAPNEDLLNFVEDATQSKIVYINHDKGGFQNEEPPNKQISYLNTYIHHEVNDLPRLALSDNGPREEVLPRPVNLREDDFDISYTNNVPTVVKGLSYKTENFGDLPLMSNSYKLDTVSSYKVPHYTVTSGSKFSPPPPPQFSSPVLSSSSSSSSQVPLEPAPPVSAAKEQSDAHLKAIKIWTHHSSGTAYTLHNDGTLSLEKAKRG